MLLSKLPLAICLLLGCAPAAQPPAPPVAGAGAATASEAPSSNMPRLPAAERRITLVQSSPLETELGDPATPQTGPTWLSMIEAARDSIELCHFYASSESDSALEAVIEALARAASRGVRVRMLLDTRLSETYASTFERLAGFVELRRWDAGHDLGGIQHAKYMIIDQAQVFLGSANFDWRSLSHVHEVGLRLEAPEIAHELADLFELDWVLAAPGKTPRPVQDPSPWSRVELDDGQIVQLVASPRGLLPDEDAWELDQLVSLIAGARERLSIELLEYDSAFRDGTPFTTLDDALRAAAARGVRVTVLLSNWQLRHPGPAQRLEQVDGIDVFIVTIPTHSSGFIPFARVIHAKYAVADGEIAWIGSSNWQGDYFHLSRNVGAVVHGQALAAQLEAVFAKLRQSPYAEPLDPQADYSPPRIGP